MSVTVVKPGPYVELRRGDLTIEARAGTSIGTDRNRDTVGLIMRRGSRNLAITVYADEMFELLHAAIAVNRGRR